MSERYFHDEGGLAPGARARLRGEEAAHLLRVIRARPGEEVVLFDGRGAEYRCRIESATQSEVRLAVLSREERDREIGINLSLAVSPPKGPRVRDLVRQLAEVGATRFIPLETERASAPERLREGGSELRALRRIAIEAAKQCGRNRLLAVEEVSTLPEAIDAMAGASLKLLADPSPRSIPLLDALGATPASGVAFLVGPEGGFSDEERGLADGAGFRPIWLGPSILRIETAAVVCASAAALCFSRPRADG